MSHLVTLTTDFGAGSCYVAALKGAMLSVNPDARIIDLTHRIPPQDLPYTANFLRAAIPYYPSETLHVVVIDPGVGTGRSILYVETAAHRLLVPDNGCWTGFAETNSPRRVIRLTNSEFWRSEISSTFHGRDIFAPVAGHLSLGVDPKRLGEATDDWSLLDLPAANVLADRINGEVVFVDDFGNLITNVSGADYRKWAVNELQITIANQIVPKKVETYGEAEAGDLVALISSMDTLEIAEAHGNAARRLGAGVATPVCLIRRNPEQPV